MRPKVESGNNKLLMSLDLYILFGDGDKNGNEKFFSGDRQGPQQTQNKLADRMAELTLGADEEVVAHLAKCMICFTAEAEVELLNCGDQLCLDCLEQYCGLLTFLG
jgi:hypothetical protein